MHWKHLYGVKSSNLFTTIFYKSCSVKSFKIIICFFSRQVNIINELNLIHNEVIYFHILLFFFIFFLSHWNLSVKGFINCCFTSDSVRSSSSLHYYLELFGIFMNQVFVLSSVSALCRGYFQKNYAFFNYFLFRIICDTVDYMLQHTSQFMNHHHDTINT